MEPIDDQELLFFGQFVANLVILLHRFVSQRMHLGKGLFKPLFEFLTRRKDFG